MTLKCRLWMLTNCMGKVGKYSLFHTIYCRQKFACHITTYMSYVRGEERNAAPTQDREWSRHSGLCWAYLKPILKSSYGSENIRPGVLSIKGVCSWLCPPSPHLKLKKKQQQQGKWAMGLGYHQCTVAIHSVAKAIIENVQGALGSSQWASWDPSDDAFFRMKGHPRDRATQW